MKEETALDRLRAQERITREELDAATSDQERTIDKLRVEVAQLKAEVEKHKRMHFTDQAYIQRLERRLRSVTDPEGVFNGK